MERDFAGRRPCPVTLFFNIGRLRSSLSLSVSYRGLGRWCASWMANCSNSDRVVRRTVDDDRDSVAATCSSNRTRDSRRGIRGTRGSPTPDRTDTRPERRLQRSKGYRGLSDGSVRPGGRRRSAMKHAIVPLVVHSLAIEQGRPPRSSTADCASH